MFRDLKQALRSWLRLPGLFLLNVLVLAIGVGAAVALFSLVQAILLRPLPYDHSEGLYVVLFKAPALGIEEFDQSPGTYLHFKESATSFEELAIFAISDVALTGEGEPRRLLAAQVTPSALRALRRAPAIGRTITEEDAQLGAPPVVVLSDHLWREQFAANPTLVGHSIRIDGIESEVAGVMPPDFRFPNSDVDFWSPLVVDRSHLQVTSFNFRGLARLRPGVDPLAATAELSALTSSLPAAYPDDLSERFLTESGMQPFLEELRHEVIGSAGSMLWIALAAVALVLAIAAANVANLLLVRAEARAAELALRTALGAGRARQLGSAAAEGLAIGLPAGLVGACLAALMLVRIRHLTGFDLPRLDEVGIGLPLFLQAIALGCIAGAALGLVSRGRVRSHSANEALRGTRSSTASRASWRTRNAFVVAQVAASTTLLLGAGLLARSFVNLGNVDPGFVPERLATFFVALPSSEYPNAEKSTAFWRRALEELRSTPGVEAASVVSKLPFNMGGHTGTLVEEFPSPDGLAYVFPHRITESEYFTASHIPLLAGRSFTVDDEKPGGGVVVTESLARRFWQAPNAALGKRIRPAGSREDGSDLPWSPVVGVVGDLRNTGLRELSNPTLYFPMTPDNGEQSLTMFFVVRTGEGLAFHLGAARNAISTVDPNVPIANLRTGKELLASETSRLRFTLVLLGVAAATATLIGGFGIFAMLLSLVGMRRREIGVRLTVGATRGDVKRLVAGAGLRLVGIGVVLGLLASAFTGRALGSFLYGVRGFDALNVLLVITFSAAVALGAAFLPATRAAAVDPARALRGD